MTTLSKLSFQEEGHGLSKMNKRHAQESMMKKKSWTHEGPSIQKKERRKEIAHVQRKMERDGS